MTTDDALRKLLDRYRTAVTAAESEGDLDTAEVLAERRDRLSRLIGHRQRQRNKLEDAAREHARRHQDQYY